jgi:Fe2+ transport system protein B
MFLLISFQVLTRWVKAHPDVIQTGSDIVDNTITVLLSTSILIGGITGCVFDHIIPGMSVVSTLPLKKSDINPKGDGFKADISGMG